MKGLKQLLVDMLMGVLDFFNRLDEHPFLGLLLFVGIIIAYYFIKSFINRQIGKLGKDKGTLELILSTAIPNEVRYIPIYAYKRERRGRHGMACWDYAIGMADDRMYIVSLTFKHKEMESSGVTIYRKEELSNIIINFSNFGETCYNVKLADKKGMPLLQFNVDDVVAKMDKFDYVNIHQKEEVNNFIGLLKRWKEEHDERLRMYN